MSVQLQTEPSVAPRVEQFETVVIGGGQAGLATWRSSAGSS